MNQQDFLKAFAEVGAIIDGHFVYASSKHGPKYVNKDAIYPYTVLVDDICEEIAFQFLRGYRVDVVAAPEKGGIILSQWVTHHLRRLSGVEERRKVLAVYAEKEGDGFVFKRGYDKLITGSRVLIVEDLMTTGSSVHKVVNAVRALDGQVVGVGAVWNRGNVMSHQIGDVPSLYSVINTQMEAHDEKDCPQCKAGIPVNIDLGHGKKFLEQLKASDV